MASFIRASESAWRSCDPRPTKLLCHECDVSSVHWLVTRMMSACIAFCLRNERVPLVGLRRRGGVRKGAPRLLFVIHGTSLDSWCCTAPFLCQSGLPAIVPGATLSPGDPHPGDQTGCSAALFSMMLHKLLKCKCACMGECILGTEIFDLGLMRGRYSDVHHLTVVL